MTGDFINILLLSGAFLVLFAIAELLYHRFNIKTEITRKLVHVGTGLLTLLFPVMLQSHWSVLLLCSIFAIILIASRKYHFLQSINNIDRESIGSIAYPVSVYAAFWFYDHYNKSHIFFYLPILILAIADPAAALVGKRWPYGKYIIRKSKKSMMGTVACFIAAFVISLVLFYINYGSVTQAFIIKSGVIAFFTAVAEGLSAKGFDNISIPFTVLVLLIFFEKINY